LEDESIKYNGLWRSSKRYSNVLWGGWRMRVSNIMVCGGHPGDIPMSSPQTIIFDTLILHPPERTHLLLHVIVE
jgi:hypothetical protein